MLKIRDDVDLKELEKYGFDFLYDEYTGNIKDIFKITYPNLILHIFPKKKKHKKIISFFKRNISNSRYSCEPECWYVDENILWGYGRYKYYKYDVDTLYELFEAGIIEKVDE